jgi:hypothetical protein
MAQKWDQQGTLDNLIEDMVVILPTSNYRSYLPIATITRVAALGCA